MSIVLALAALAASPAAQAGTQVLYTPVRDAADQKITVKGWGSGSGAESDEAAYEGTHSIRVSTRNFFQGADVAFGDPKDLSSRYADRNNLLKIVLRLADAAPTGVAGGSFPGGSGSSGSFPGGAGGPGRGGPGGRGGGGRGGFPGGGGGFPGGAPGGFPGGAGGGRGGFPGGQGGQGRPGGGFPGGGFPGGGLPGGGFPGGPSGMGASSSAPAPLTTVRVIVTTTDGKKSEAYLPVSTNAAAERGWKTVAIPLQAINGFDRTNKIVKDIAFSGDATTTFFVGDLRVVNDATPIRAEIQGQRTYNLSLAQGVNLVGRGEGGASVLEYVWDFDDADGTDDQDAIGQAVYHKFRRSNAIGKNTTVTLTVRDKYGLKPPAKATVQVHVNP